MTFTETMNQAVSRFCKAVLNFFDRLAEQLRPVWKKLIGMAKKVPRHRVHEMTFNPDRRIATAARIWLRTKNRRIKRKQLRLLFPQEGW